MRRRSRTKTIEVVFLALSLVATYALFIHDGGALFMHFVDAVAPLLADQMLDNAGQ